MERRLMRDWKEAFLNRFEGQGSGEPLFVPDLSLWYPFHLKRDTLPSEWRSLSQAEIAWECGGPAWVPVRPWRLDYERVQVVTDQEEGKRTVRYLTELGELSATWTKGPEGDWWQLAYPVKRGDDLDIALQIVRDRKFVLEFERYRTISKEVGRGGIVPIELPRHPFSDLLHEFLGWSEGLFLMETASSQIEQILMELMTRRDAMVEDLMESPGEILLSPDNLDGQFISPDTFVRFMAEGYARTARRAREAGKHLLVHVGGPIRHLLGPLASSGVDGVEGISGPPQSDISLSEARKLVGPGMTLWGGIPQDLLLDIHDRESFRMAALQGVSMARGDRRMLLGVADRVPVDADLGRLRSLAGLIQGTSG
jgi:hypothetical protein